MAPEPLEVLKSDLSSIYSRAGAEVRYETEAGNVKPYWAYRYKQSLNRAIHTGRIIEFVNDLVEAPDPSRGFFVLRAAGRLDLSLEALVADDGEVLSRSLRQADRRGCSPSAREVRLRPIDRRNERRCGTRSRGNRWSHLRRSRTFGACSWGVLRRPDHCWQRGRAFVSTDLIVISAIC